MERVKAEVRLASRAETSVVCMVTAGARVTFDKRL